MIGLAVGGLISYGSDSITDYRRAASYVDRILKGEKPAELAVQAPTKYELVINCKTATTLGLTIPPLIIFFSCASYFSPPVRISARSASLS